MKATAAISLRHVTIRHAASGQPAVRDVSFELARGTWTALVGMNGSGKSTLAKAIAGLEPPSEGTINTGKVAIHIVLQNPDTQILGETVFEEIALSLKHGDNSVHGDQRGRALAILGEAGLDLPLDAPTERLSGGQKQLLNIASCLAAEADLALLDEVTAMLDPHSAEQVLDAVRKLHEKGAAVLWITHRPEELVHAQRVLVLERGRLAFNGFTREFLYGSSSDKASPCLRFGMEPPFIVRLVRQLERKGVRLAQYPLLPEHLSRALIEHADCR